MQHHLFEHFFKEGHCSFLDDITIIFIDKTHPKYPKRQEHFSRDTLKAMTQLGLNVEVE